jgi:hypothetical protein
MPEYVPPPPGVRDTVFNLRRGPLTDEMVLFRAIRIGRVEPVSAKCEEWSDRFTDKKMAFYNST